MKVKRYVEGEQLAHLVENGEALCKKRVWPGYWAPDSPASEAHTMLLCIACADKAVKR